MTLDASWRLISNYSNFHVFGSAQYDADLNVLALRMGSIRVALIFLVFLTMGLLVCLVVHVCADGSPAERGFPGFHKK